MNRIIETFISKYWKSIRKKKNVVGYSGVLHPRIKDGVEIPDTKCVRIYVVKKEPEYKLRAKDIIPRVLNLGCKIETDIVEIGRVRFLDSSNNNSVVRTTPEDHRKKYRPYPAGVSATNIHSTACTLNFFFKKKMDTSLGVPRYKVLIAGNYHCFALEGKAKEGDPILQPSPYDNGTSSDIIGRFLYGVPVEYSEYKCPIRQALYRLYRALKFMVTFKDTEPSNKVDIAFAEPINVEDIKLEILGIPGRVVGLGEHKKGTIIYKAGRTSGVTSGPIEDPYWCGYVQGRRGVAFFVDCVLCKAKCSPGDSGSPVVSYKEMDKLLYHGALFAGSNNENLVYCKAENIIRESGAEVILYA